MVEPLVGLDWLSEYATTTNQRLAVTFAATGIVLIVLLSSRSLQQWLNVRIRPLYSDIITTVLLFGTFSLSVLVTLGVWGQTGQIQQVYAEYELGGDFIAKILVTVVVFVSTYIVVRVIRRFIRELLTSSNAVSDHQRKVTHRVVQATVWGTGFFVVLGVWIDDLGGLLVGAGFLGIVLGMAARQTLGSMLAGFVLMFARPFEIGDWVKIDEQEGVVTDISIINTQIQSFNGEYVMVPNDVVGSSMVSNLSKRGILRVEINVGVDYDTEVDRARELITTAIEDVDAALSAPTPNVVTQGFGDSSIELRARFWIDKPSSRRRWNARTAAIDRIRDVFETEGIKIPFPQRELSTRPEPDGPEAHTDSIETAEDTERTVQDETTHRNQPNVPPEDD